MLSCLEVFQSVHQYVCPLTITAKITPKCLCICTGDSEISLKSNIELFSKCLVLKIIISVLLELKLTSHLYDHAFQYSKSVLFKSM